MLHLRVSIPPCIKCIYIRRDEKVMKRQKPYKNIHHHGRSECRLPITATCNPWKPVTLRHLCNSKDMHPSSCMATLLLLLLSSFCACIWGLFSASSLSFSFSCLSPLHRSRMVSAGFRRRAATSPKRSTGSTKPSITSPPRLIWFLSFFLSFEVKMPKKKPH